MRNVQMWQAKEDSRGGPGLSILLADDDRAILEAYGTMLEDEGYHVTRVRDGDAAMQALSGRTFDVVITDIVLPGVNGLILLRRASALQPDTPVIVITGYRLTELQSEFKDSGAFAFLTKPVPRAQLLSTVKVAISSHRRKELRPPKVEIFIGGSPLDEMVIQQVLRLALPLAEVMVYDIRKVGMDRAKECRITGVPAVVVNGKYVDCISALGVNLEKLKAAGLGPQPA